VRSDGGGSLSFSAGWMRANHEDGHRSWITATAPEEITAPGENDRRRP